MKILILLYIAIDEKSAYPVYILMKYVFHLFILIYIYISVQRNCFGLMYFPVRQGERRKEKYISRIFGYILYYIVISGFYVSLGAQLFVYLNSQGDRILASLLTGPVFYIVSVLISLGPFFWIASGIDPSPEAEKTSSFSRLQQVFWRLSRKIFVFHGILFFLGIPVLMPELVPWPAIELPYPTDDVITFLGIAWSQLLLVVAVIGTSIFVVDEYVSVTPRDGIREAA